MIFFVSLMQAIQTRSNASRCHGNARVRGPVIETQRVSIGRRRRAARKDNIVNIATPLVRLLRAENPLVGTVEATFRGLQIE